MLMANSSAIITDAFPVDQRGLGLGLNMVAGIAGSFIGLVDRAACSRRSSGSWSSSCRCRSACSARSGPTSGCATPGCAATRRMDWWGNVTFAVGLIAVLVGITYGIQPYAGHTWAGPTRGCSAALIGGTCRAGAVLRASRRKVARPDVPARPVPDPGVHAGNVASLLSALGRGGLMFILIIWLQGIWLPRHGYSFESTPLWAGIFMLPMTVGLPRRRAGLGLALRPVRCPPLRHRGDARGRASFVWLLRTAGRLHLLAVRRRPAGQRPRHGPVRRTEPGGHHEQPCPPHRAASGAG